MYLLMSPVLSAANKYLLSPEKSIDVALLGNELKRNYTNGEKLKSYFLPFRYFVQVQ